MRLSPADANAVVTYLNRFPKPICAVCRHDQWKVSDILFALPEYDSRPSWARPGLRSLSDLAGDTMVGDSLEHKPFFGSAVANLGPTPQVFPVIPVTCVTCGYVFFMSAVAIGIVPGSK